MRLARLGQIDRAHIRKVTYGCMAVKICPAKPVIVPSPVLQSYDAEWTALG